MRLSTTRRICLWAGVSLVVLVSVATTATTTKQHKLPALFDFDNYKRVFSKSYGSMLEELERKRLFFARAFGAFVTGAKYKFRLLTYWQALNHLSDSSEAERERMLNSAMMDEARALGIPEGRDDLPELLEQIVEGRKEFRTLRDACQEGRVKRSVEPKARHFSLDQLIADPHRIDGKPIDKTKPNYSLLKQQERVKRLNVGRSEDRSRVQQFTDYLNSWTGTNRWLPKYLRTTLRHPMHDEAAEASDNKLLPDTMFVDLRQSSCMFERVRDQGDCGACYAFASTTLMEWWHCKKTSGKLVAFSEQYMVDCGAWMWPRLRGCTGGTNEGVARFIHNFGLELRHFYPYRDGKGKCPYRARNQDLKQTGFMRAEINSMALIHVSKWHEALQRGPLFVGLGTGGDFLAYGGGVYDGSGCRWPENHAMVLVGHGREDGQEFWLIRNSYSRLWGERGYLKLSKQKAHKCILREAFAFGTSDGLNYEFEFSNVTTRGVMSADHHSSRS